MQTSTNPAQESGVWGASPSNSLQIRYGSVSWSFHTPHCSVKPPHYHGSLLRTSRPRRRYAVIWNAKPFGPSQHPTTLPHDPAEEWSPSDLLNPQFIAVKVAEQVLQSYEVDVGFAHSPVPDISSDQSESSRAKLSDDVDEEQVQLGRSQWAVLARDLIGDIYLPGAVSTPDIDVTRPQSSLSSLEYDSEPSTDTDLPRTPMQKSTFSSAEVQLSPVSDTNSLSPPKTLNRSARAFTPKSGAPSKHNRSLVSPSSDLRTSSSPSPTPINFTFPAINSNYQYLPQSLKKDDQGFYTSVTPPDSPSRTHLGSRLSCTRLPHFLSDAQSRNHKGSKTRVIVDKMKAIPVPSKKGRSRNKSELPSEEADGPRPERNSVSRCNARDAKKSNCMKGDNRGQDPDATLNFSPTHTADPLVSAGNNGVKGHPSSPTEASFPSSTTAAGCTVKPVFTDVSFMQHPAPSFYTISHAAGYPYSYVLRGAPPPPAVTSWVAIAPPVYPNTYTRSVMVPAAW